MKQFRHLMIVLTGLFATTAASAQESTYLIHKADAASITGTYTQIDHENMNKKVFLYPLITHNFNPGGGAGVYSIPPVTVGREQDNWRVMNCDFSAFKENTYWNIFLPGPDFKSWAHVTTAQNTSLNYTLIDHPDLNNNPNALVYVSNHYNPGGGAGKVNNHTVGVFYSTGMKKWAIFNQDVAAMEEGLSFSIAFEDNSDHVTFVHKSDAGNTNGHITIIDNPACNGNPNAKVILTQNWNPGGTVGGVYNNHEAGIYYNGKNWAIYNEDKTDLADGAAFNILVVYEQPASTNKEDLMNIPSLRIAPNPVNAGESVQIDLYNESSDDLHIEVMDMTGKTVANDDIASNGNVVIHRLSTAGLEPGMYMIRVYNTRIAAVRRLVVN